ncbi:MAG TPA: YciC family protein [Solirubrobacterales bacterium]|nr:YciC family protein [Solirubrobacterales bacterium]
MERTLDIGATLSEVFSTYRSQAGVLLPAAFWLFLVVAIIDGLISTNLALVPIALAVSVIAATLYQGMVVGLVRDVQEGRRDSSTGELMRSAVPVIGPLIGASLLFALGVGIGFVLFVIPGLILLTIWYVFAPVIVVERTGVLAAFGRSRALVRGDGWRVFAAIFVVFMVTAIAGLLLSAIGASIASGAIVRIVFSAIASTLTAPIEALLASVLYFRLRAIRDAAGPQGADPGTPPAPPGPAAV